MDIVMITRDRPELTAQTIESMRRNAADWSRHILTIVYDGTADEERAFARECYRLQIPWYLNICTGKQLGVGGAKNTGAEYCKEYGSSELLMFTDNDMYYLPGWDEHLEKGLESGIYKYPASREIVQLGGWRHPYHAGVTYQDKIEVDAVTGNCFIIRWSDWLKYGPFDANAIGPGQSEDYALSQRIKAAGGVVATLDPPIAIHCGLVNSVGEPATGWRECELQITEQLAQMDASERERVLIMRPSVEGRRFIRHNQPLTLPDTNSPDDEAVIDHSAMIYGVRLNVGSGQRPFSYDLGKWINVDAQSVPPDRVPDIMCNVGPEPLPFADGSVDMVVLHQCLEHAGCGEATPMLRECWRVLRVGGSMIITVPDMRALAGRWLGGEITDQIYMTNVYGAYMGDDADRHRWGYTWSSLSRYVLEAVEAKGIGEEVREFDWREIPGANIARDWWILGIEAIKR